MLNLVECQEIGARVQSARIGGMGALDGIGALGAQHNVRAFSNSLIDPRREGL